MSYDSNTKVALLVAKFLKVLLFSFSALSLSNNSLVYDLLEDYRGYRGGRQLPTTNKQVIRRISLNQS